MKTANKGVQTDLDRSTLLDRAIAGGEGSLADNGALVVRTGHRTGRSPRDRFYVKNHVTEDAIAWGDVNQPLSPAVFEALWCRVATWLECRDHYLGHYHGGAHPQHHMALQVHTETAWHQLFAHNLFIRPDHWNPNDQAPMTILNAPGFVCDPERDGTRSDGIVAIDLQGRRILLAGMPYAGEMKKAVFSALNFWLPEQEILPMHCSANQGQDGRTALFFGLSGTGKTTLSADPNRLLIGDDEHGWGTDGVFNFEGGCYAKCVDLSPEKEPVIHQAIRHQAV
ncbi:MAG: phosphoenolpyruvate carboxykinase (ATP), partial [Natronospirillum sp.]|uniref:phosphoenolpyruvate carboxykinase (ATP) n=1 Tax=Natronospirillum sp. TaxID=2812955 RepID=UPI0025E89422